MDGPEDRLQVRLSNPQNGWMEVSVSTPNGEFKEAVSFTPNDFVLELTQALSLSMQGVDGLAVASCEPVTYELRFSGVTETKMAELQIHKYPDWNRNRKSACAVLSFQATRLGVILPFWRALSSLEGRVATPEYRRAMRRDFPSSCLERLTQLVSDKRI